MWMDWELILAKRPPPFEALLPAIVTWSIWASFSDQIPPPFEDAILPLRVTLNKVVELLLL